MEVTWRQAFNAINIFKMTRLAVEGLCAFAYNEDPEEQVHPHSINKAFAVRM